LKKKFNKPIFMAKKIKKSPAKIKKILKTKNN